MMPLPPTRSVYRAAFATLDHEKPLVLACCLMAATALFGVSAGGLFENVARHGDNPSYLAAAAAMRAGAFHTIVPKHFLGLSYVVAAVSALTGMREALALYLISVAAFAFSVWLTHRLWGPRVAIAFATVDYAWLEFSGFGGAEPLFVAMILASLWEFRSQRLLSAVVLASLASTVRPLGAFLVLALIWDAWRNRGTLAAVTFGVVPLAVAALYAVPLSVSGQGALANVRFYRAAAWLGGWPVALPFSAIVNDYLHGPSVGNAVIRHVKVAVVLLHVVALAGLVVSERVRRRAAEAPTVTLFASSYSLFMLVYNSPTWALSIYPRLVIPVIPFFLWLYEAHLPRKRVVYFAFGGLSLTLACGAGLGFARAASLARRWTG